MKTKSKIFVASSLIVTLTLTIALICVLTMYIDGNKIIDGEIKDIASVKIKFSVCYLSEEERIIELSESEIQNFADIIQNSKFKKVNEKVDSGGYSITVKRKDGAEEKFSIVGSGEYILYRNNYYKSYSAIGYFVSDLFKTE